MTIKLNRQMQFCQQRLVALVAGCCALVVSQLEVRMYLVCLARVAFTLFLSPGIGRLSPY